MDTAQAAYLAGLMDGEGCISVERKRPNGAEKSYRYILNVSIQMSELSSIAYVADFTGRAIMNKKVSSNMKKPAFRINWQAQKAAEMLSEILPFLHGKHDQALEAIAFAKTVATKRLIGSHLSNEELVLRERHYQNLQRLKRSTSS